MRLEDLKIEVFKVDNENFESIGEISQYTSLMWPDKFSGYDSFQLCAPITERNKELIKEDNIIWIGENKAAVIEIIESDSDDKGQKSYKVKGRTLEMLLTTRIVWDMYECVNKNASTAMYDIVKSNCVTPSNESRKIPHFVCAKDEKFGKVISYQKTGGDVYDAIVGIASDADIGFEVAFKPDEKKIVFRVIQGSDRTIIPSGDSSTNPIVFSTDLEDIYTSSYYFNKQDLRNVALVAGEDSGENRKKEISGDNALKGFLRREMYVDARDLQSKKNGSDGSQVIIPEDEYRAMLRNRGDEKLSDRVISETFDAKIRAYDNPQYEYGKDYFLGDKVIIQDFELGIQVIGRITKVSENFGVDNKYEFIITFGYSYPTIIQKVKRLL